MEYKYITTYKKVNETRNAITKLCSDVLRFSDRPSVNYDFIKNHSLGANVRYNKSKSSPAYSSWSDLSDETTIIRSGTSNKGDRWNDQYQASLYYTWKLNNKGSLFKLTGDYLHYETNTRANYEYIYNFEQDDQKLDYAKNKIDNKVNMFFTKVLFHIKPGKNSILEFGANYNSNRTHQTLIYQELTKDSWIPDDNRSDNYKLTGDNYAGFIGFSSKIGSKVNYKLSTRFEHHEMIYNSRQMGLENKKSYNSISVLANFIYFLNREEGNLFHCFYERSCYSIPYSAISPIVTYINEHSYTKGNLNLEPSVSNEWWLILSLQSKWEFAFRIFTDKDNLYYRTFVDDQNNLVSYTMPVNGLSSLNFRLTAERSLKITDWWQMEVSGLLEWYKMNSSEDVSRTLVSIATVDNSLDFKSGIGGMVNFFWKSGSKQLEKKYGQGGSIEMSVYKYLFDRKLQITLAGNLYQHERWVTRHTNEIYSKQYPQTAYSGILVRISYNFKRGEKVKIKKNDNVQTYEEAPTLFPYPYDR